MIKDILRRIGLTEYETKTYLALLDLNKATSGEILKKADINTGKIYDILNSLKNKGFISEIKEAGVKKFFPADPKQIFDFLEAKKQDILEQETTLEDIMPKLLEKINTTQETPKIEVFYGLKGLKIAHQKEIDRYSSKETLRVLGIMQKENYPKHLYNFYINNLYPKRKQKKIAIKKILDESAKKHRKDHESQAKIKYFPYVSPVAIVTIKDLTIIDISTENPITITIESSEVAKSFIQQFELLWKISKK